MIFQGGMVWLISFYFLCKYCRLLLCSYHVVVSHSVVSDSLWPHVLQHTRFPCPSLSPGICSNSLPLSRWCHIYISSSVALLSSCPQSFPAPGSFSISWLFTSVGQSIGASASVSVFSSVHSALISFRTGSGHKCINSSFTLRLIFTQAVKSQLWLRWRP